MEDKEMVKAETKPQAAVKGKAKKKTSAKRKKRKKASEEKIYRAIGCRFTEEEYKYVEKMLIKLEPIYKTKNKILLELMKEFVSSPLNDEVLNRNGRISLGKWATIFRSCDMRRVLIVYLQLTRNLYAAPTRKYTKYSFIDFEMLDTDGNRIGIIVRSDDAPVELDEIDNMKKKIKMFLFTTDEKKKNLGDRDIEHIPLKNVFEVIEKHKFLLPFSIVRKFKRIGNL